MRRRLRSAGLLGLAAAALAALVVFGLAPGKTVIGRIAPALPRERLAGTPLSLAALLAGAHGRPSVVVFWASWCGPCVREAPALERFSRAGGHGRIVGVDWSDARTGALAFIRRYGWTFPTVRDSEGRVGNAYGMTGLPTIYVLDGRGRIRLTLRGPQTEASLSRALGAVAAS
jgi:thiol-disulfide isomerase/thioredoxin